VHEEPARIPVHEGDGTDGLPENVGLQRYPTAQLSANSNVFVERLWCSVRYEEVYLKAYESVSQARQSIADYLTWYNQRRPHSSLADRTAG
jgi:putative transposase